MIQRELDYHKYKKKAKITTLNDKSVVILFNKNKKLKILTKSVTCVKIIMTAMVIMICDYLLFRMVNKLTRLFEGLSKEKQTVIINAALDEFTKNGYDKASTNVIVKNAGISKGALFKYFSNKMSLYFYLYEFSENIINDIYKQIDYNITDYFDRLKNVGEIKFVVIRKYPQVFNFLKSSLQETNSEVKEFVNKKRDFVIEKGFNNIYKGVDFSKFRDDIDLKVILDLIERIMFSYNEEYTNKLESYADVDKSYLEKWNNYFEVLRKLFYK